MVTNSRLPASLQGRLHRFVHGDCRPWGAINTKVPGIRLSEMLPHHARWADKMAFIRSLHHDNGDHFAAGHWMLTGRFGSTAVNLPQKYPSVGSYVSRVRGANQPG